MAVLICDAPCKNRSRRPLKSWKTKDGGKCYGCGLKYAVVSRVFDADGDIAAVAGEGNMATCSFYDPIESEKDDEEDDI